MGGKELHETRVEYYQAERRVDVPKCDLCKKEVSNQRNSCPSETPLLQIFIGHNNLQYDPSGYSPYPLGSKYGVEGIELCKGCRESWFNDILEQFPNAKLVKLND